ncbi:MAG TPA: TonB-dependent receptor, partial [Candidatus Sulfopaludibacter sp.]|nr:TonB-dependent receptor [Candidatus Sulfopaludibacter sp.]
YVNSRDKQPPIGLGTSLSGDPGQYAVDGRSLVGVAYKRGWGPGELQWQMFYDRYRYHDRYDYPQQGEIDAVGDYNDGDTLDSQLTYALPVRQSGTLTVGAQGSWDLRAQQFNMEDGARQQYANHPDHEAAIFVQQEWNLTSRWKLYGGVRLEQTRNFGFFVSPRLAAVYQPSARTAYKLVYGRPYRNPSAFEQYYNDGGLSYAPAAPLEREVAQTFQASMERQAARGWTWTLDAFHYRVSRVIEAVDVGDGVQQYQNAGRLHTTGVEAEVAGKLWRRVEASASGVWQRAGGAGGATLPNSPRELVKSRVGVPVSGDRLFLSGALQYIAARNAWSGDRLGGALLADFTATWRVHPRCDVVAGLRNAFDRRYEDPIFLAVDRYRGDGRSAFLKLVWRVWE